MLILRAEFFRIQAGMVTLILLVFSFVCLALAAFWNPAPPRVNLVAAGLAFYVLSVLLSGAHLAR